MAGNPSTAAASLTPEQQRAFENATALVAAGDLPGALSCFLGLLEEMDPAEVTRTAEFVTLMSGPLGTAIVDAERGRGPQAEQINQLIEASLARRRAAGGR